MSFGRIALIDLYCFENIACSQFTQAYCNLVKKKIYNREDYNYSKYLA